MNEGAATLTACGIDDGFGGFNRQYLLEGTAYITYCWNECTRCDGSDPVSAASVKSNSVTLNKIYPNPFSGSTRVDLNVVQSGSLKVRVYNILGQPVATLFDGFAGAGSLSLNWDGTTQTGELAREGAYLIRVEMGQNATTHRVLLNR
jgi:flagellar hook assembly protein FlgD